MSHAVTVPPGRGVDALEAPQDRHGQEHRTGTSRAEQTKEAMAKQGAQETMAELGALETMAELGALEDMAELGALASVPSARPLQPEPFYPPLKISMVQLGGIRSPPGLNRQDKTVPQEQEALLG